MPLYVYVCNSCGNKSEQLRRFDERLDPATCPECSAKAKFALSLSAPSFVGAASGSDCFGAGPGPGGACCGGGACGLN